VTLDCDDPGVLASFYQRATGYELSNESTDEFAGITSDDGLFIGFQRVANYGAPSWPTQNNPQQFHLDFVVDNLDDAEAALMELGATKPRCQPDASKWRVLLDPAGHPFCITLS
jgi:hypothetical protein